MTSPEPQLTDEQQNVLVNVVRLRTRPRHPVGAYFWLAGGALGKPEPVNPEVVVALKEAGLIRPAADKDGNGSTRWERV